MKKHLLILLAVPVFSASLAQNMNGTPPDFDVIKRETADPASPRYLPKLMARFRLGDTSLKKDDRRSLYFGYSFSDQYSPYPHSQFDDSLRTFQQSNDTPDEAGWRLIVRYADSILADDPFNMRVLLLQSHASERLGDLQRKHENLSMVRIIIDAIFSTGDGKTKQTAFYVIAVPHEYSLLRALGFQFGGKQKLVDGHYDYLKLAKNEYGIEGLYFDVSRSMAGMMQLLGGGEEGSKKKRKE